MCITYFLADPLARRQKQNLEFGNIYKYLMKFYAMTEDEVRLQAGRFSSFDGSDDIRLHVRWDTVFYIRK